MPPRPRSRRLVAPFAIALLVGACRDDSPTALTEPATKERPRLSWYASLEEAPLATDVTIDIPDKPVGASWFVGLAMNDALEVAGYVFPGNGKQLAFRWRSTTGAVYLTPPGDPDQRCLAAAINDLGTMAGVCATTVPFHVRAWMGPSLSPITPAGGTASVEAMSNTHVVVGSHGATLASPRRAYRFAGALQILAADLDIQPEEEYEAYDVNDAGTAVGGRYSFASPATHAALRWAPGAAASVEVEVLPLGDMFIAALARAIDADGNVYGEAWTEIGDQHFVKWAPDGTLEHLTPDGPVGVCQIHDANDAGVLVGQCLVGGGPQAFRWTPGGVGFERLDLSPYVNGEGYAIRNDGSILGYVQEPYGSEPSYRLVLWLPDAPLNRDPVPVPRGPYTGVEGGAVTLDGTTSYDPDGDAITYEWDFGDGTAHAYTALASHVYADDGTYTATLTVRDGRGGVASASAEVRVSGAAPLVSKLSFAFPWIVAPPAGAGWHFDFAFTDKAPADGPFAWRVDWGDGSAVATGARPTPGTVTPSHTYATPGVRTVTIRVTDKNGLVGTRSFPVSVR